MESKLSSSSNLSDHGVPQGSILGGLIFIIFSNDFPESSNAGESSMYVDDDTDVAHDGDPDQLKEKIQYEADCSANWLADNRMCVAGEKTKLLIVGTKRLRSSKLVSPIEITVDNMEVTETKSEKLLGIIINNELTWKEHLYGETWRDRGNNSSRAISKKRRKISK